MKTGKFEQKDLETLNEFIDDFPVTCGELRLKVEELIDDCKDDNDNESVEFWNIVLNCLQKTEGLKLFEVDEPEVESPDGFSMIDNIMRTLHYDNGKPLTTDEYNYFEHYDRDQDFWGFYEDVLVDHFELDKEGNLVLVVVMDEDELRDQLTDLYDGSSWEHDFH